VTLKRVTLDLEAKLLPSTGERTHDSGVGGDDHRETSSETSGDAFDDPYPDTDPAPLFDATSKESVGDGERVVSESTRRGTTTLSYRSGPSRVPN
jgi:hypothetical protein